MIPSAPWLITSLERGSAAQGPIQGPSHEDLTAGSQASQMSLNILPLKKILVDLERVLDAGL